LTIMDRGEGVAPQHVEKLFEPFFTTGRGGTGLGLYLARELCESNQAQLRYQPRNDDTGSCFVITFAHPERRQYT
ncbi:MAG: ATP-binding protein, partial [Gammaproteobacteria bacterium]|nr:ATP-binding protein [Gammaproteobacteria bacterium]